MKSKLIKNTDGKIFLICNDPNRYILERRLLITHLINSFNLNTNSKILDLGGADYKKYCSDKQYLYTSINVEDPIKFGDLSNLPKKGELNGNSGGNTLLETIRYDGKNLPFKNNDFDVIIVNFVLHHAAENTIPLLKQIKNISPKYVIIGEDLAEINYDLKWHTRNFEHQPGGIFRSDLEWKELFDLIGFKLIAQIIIRRSEDIDEKYYRSIYVLSTR
jgi:SAM-dependent methyltransferase